MQNYIKGRSIGEKLFNARKENGCSLEQVAHDTRIPIDQLWALEKNEFDKIPSHVYAKGFIKNYAKYLGISAEPLVAQYRRDIENLGVKRKVIKLEEKKDNGEKIDLKKLKSRITFEFTERKLLIAVAFIFFVVALITVVRIIKSSFSPPYLKVTSPIEVEGSAEVNFISEDDTVVIKGYARKNTTVKINETPVGFKPGYVFETDPIPVLGNENVVVISAESKLGVVTEIKLNVIRENVVPSSNQQNAKIPIIKIINEPTMLIARADGEVKYSNEAMVGDTFSLKAEQSFEIETANPRNIVVLIDGEEINLENSLEVFNIVEGKWVKNQ